MQSLRRSPRVAGSSITLFRASKAYPARVQTEFMPVPNWSPCDRGPPTNFIQQSASYSKDCVFRFPVKCSSWNSPRKENILHVRRELTPSYYNMTSPFSIIGDNSTVRGITTLGHSEESFGQDISAASPNPDLSQRIKFKRLSKTAKNIMNILDKEAVEKVQSDREIPDIRPGYIIQLKVEVPENKRRVSTLKGIVIARRNAGLHTTFRLRRLVAGVGVESVFPLYSPNIKEMKVLDKKKVRRAKLYYLRDRMNPLKK